MRSPISTIFWIFAACYVTNASESCADENGVSAVDRCSSSFVSCKNGIPTRQKCPGDLIYNPAASQCDFRENIEGCVTGKRDHPADDESQSIKPLQQVGGKSQKSDSKHILGYSDNAQKEECTAGERVAVGSCQSAFIECRSGQKVVKNCPTGTLFDQKYGICLYDVPACTQRTSAYPTTSDPTSVPYMPLVSIPSGPLVQGVCQAGMNYPRGECMSSYFHCRDGVNYEQMECPVNHRFDPVHLDCRAIHMVGTCLGKADSEPIYVNNAADGNWQRDHKGYDETPVHYVYRHHKKHYDDDSSDDIDEEDRGLVDDLFQGKGPNYPDGILSNPFYRSHRFGPLYVKKHRSSSRGSGRHYVRSQDAFEGKEVPEVLSNPFYDGGRSVKDVTDNLDKKSGKLTNSIFKFFPDSNGRPDYARRAESEEDDSDEDIEGSGIEESEERKRSKRYAHHGVCPAESEMQTLSIGVCQQNFVLCTENLEALVAACPVGEVFNGLDKVCTELGSCGMARAHTLTSENTVVEVPTEHESQQVDDNNKIHEQVDNKDKVHEQLDNDDKIHEKVDSNNKAHDIVKDDIVALAPAEEVTEAAVSQIAPVVHSPCASLADGVYSMGCSSDYLSCVAGIAHVSPCPTGLYFDVSSSSCNVRGEIKECGILQDPIHLPHNEPSENFAGHVHNDIFDGVNIVDEPIVPFFNQYQQDAVIEDQWQSDDLEVESILRPTDAPVAHQPPFPAQALPPTHMESLSRQREGPLCSSDGSRLQSCDGHFVVCASGRQTLFRCTNGMNFDEASGSCSLNVPACSRITAHPHFPLTEVQQKTIGHNEHVANMPIQGEIPSPMPDVATFAPTSASELIEELDAREEEKDSLIPSAVVDSSAPTGTASIWSGPQKLISEDQAVPYRPAMMLDDVPARIQPYRPTLDKSSFGSDNSDFGHVVHPAVTRSINAEQLIPTSSAPRNEAQPAPYRPQSHVVPDEKPSGVEAYRPAVTELNDNGNENSGKNSIPVMPFVHLPADEESRHSTEVSELCSELDGVVGDACAPVFFECRDGVAQKILCGGGLVFNPKTSSCESPSKVAECPSIVSDTEPVEEPVPSVMSLPTPRVDEPRNEDSPTAAEEQELHQTEASKIPANGAESDSFEEDYDSGKGDNEMVSRWIEDASDTERTAPQDKSSLPDEIEVSTMAALSSGMACEFDASQPAFPLAACSFTYAMCHDDGFAVAVNCSQNHLFDHSVYKCVPSEECGRSQLLEIVAAVESGGTQSSPRDVCVDAKDGARKALGDCMKSFVECGRHPVVSRCPKNLVFSEKDEACVPAKSIAACRIKPDSAKTVPSHHSPAKSMAPTASVKAVNTADFCKTNEDGTYRHPEDCASIVQCHQGSMLLLQPCTSGLVFNNFTKACDYAYNVAECASSEPSDKTGAGCNGHEHGAHVEDPQDCSIFWRCVWRTFVRMECPAGTVFNPEIAICDWPAAVPSCVDGTRVTPALSLDGNSIDSHLRH